MVDWSLSSRVSPFRYLRIKDYLHLPVAFRSLSRLSSALSAKASTLRSWLLDLVVTNFAPVRSKQAWNSLCFVVTPLEKKSSIFSRLIESSIALDYLSTIRTIVLRINACALCLSYPCFASTRHFSDVLNSQLVLLRIVSRFSRLDSRPITANVFYAIQASLIAWLHSRAVLVVFINYLCMKFSRYKS